VVASYEQETAMSDKKKSRNPLLQAADAAADAVLSTYRYGFSASKPTALKNAILSSVSFAIIATDASGIIQLFNQGAQRMLGYGEDEVVNRIRPSDLHDPQEVLQRANLLSAELETPIAPGFEALAYKASRGMEDTYEITYIRKDGSRFPASVSISALRDKADDIIGYLLIAADVSARKRVDDELRLAVAAANQASHAKSEFLSRMSHELRTPLNVILGFAQLVDAGAPKLNAKRKRNMEQIQKAGWYLLDLINEILDLSAIESGQVALSMESVSLVGLMRECLAMIEPQAQLRGIGIGFDSPHSPFFVHADRTRLKQVMINLLNNAIKYNRPGGTVTVNTDQEANGMLRINVRDTGNGLRQDQIAQLFQPFNRLGKESSSEEGSGIGLVVTRSMMELMGGTVEVESSVGVGSNFWITLPVSLATTVADIKAKSEAVGDSYAPRGEGATPLTLLYVEDNPANLEFMTQLIGQRADLHLLTAKDAASGIELARAQLPALILMDVDLPGINGLEAMTVLRADPGTMHIPIIAVSANAMPRDIQRGMDAGFFDYITKPIRVPAFMEQLNTALAFTQTVAHT